MENFAYVQVRGSNVRGQVYHFYSQVGWIDDDEELAGSTRYGPSPMRYVNDQWVSILLDDQSMGLTDLYPISLLEEIEPFQMDNTYTTWYIPTKHQYHRAIKAWQRRVAS